MGHCGHLRVIVGVGVGGVLGPLFQRSDPYGEVSRAGAPALQSLTVLFSSSSRGSFFFALSTLLLLVPVPEGSQYHDNGRSCGGACSCFEYVRPELRYAPVRD